MAYDIATDNKQSDLASLSGWKQFKEEIDPTPLFSEFIETGTVKSAGDLYEELTELNADDLSDSSQGILSGMLDFLQGEEGEVSISDGLTSEEVEDDWHVSD